MPTTPTFALPYPTLSDTADVPRDIQALATRLDGLALVPPIVTSLPGSPIDGQEVYYQADATNGVYWHLRYRSGATGSYKWEFIGGPPLAADSIVFTTFAGFSANTWGTLVATLKVTLPLAGDYDVQTGASMRNNTATAALFLGLRQGSTDPANTGDAAIATVPAANYATLSLRRRLTARPAAQDITQRQMSSATGDVGVSNAHIAAWPVRVG